MNKYVNSRCPTRDESGRGRERGDGLELIPGHRKTLRRNANPKIVRKGVHIKRELHGEVENSIGRFYLSLFDVFPARSVVLR